MLLKSLKGGIFKAIIHSILQQASLKPLSYAAELKHSGQMSFQNKSRIANALQILLFYFFRRKDLRQILDLKTVTHPFCYIDCLKIKLSLSWKNLPLLRLRVLSEITGLLSTFLKVPKIKRNVPKKQKFPTMEWRFHVVLPHFKKRLWMPVRGVTGRGMGAGGRQAYRDAHRTDVDKLRNWCRGGLSRLSAGQIACGSVSI